MGVAAIHPGRSIVAPGAMPAPERLAALGAVLCLYRAQPGGELTGWVQAVRAEAVGDVDSDGLSESLRFLDAQGQCCWQLFLLPDSDFMAWERLAHALPARGDAAARVADVGERLWSRLARRVLGERWHASALRLHALHCGPGSGVAAGPVLAASLAELSAPGMAAAHRIALAQGVDAGSLGDECCCERAARTAARAARVAVEQDAHPLIRLGPGETT